MSVRRALFGSEANDCNGFPSLQFSVECGIRVRCVVSLWFTPIFIENIFLCKNFSYKVE